MEASASVRVQRVWCSARVAREGQRATCQAYGVIGNTAVFGTVILGSSPSRPAFLCRTADEDRWQTLGL